MINDHIKNDRVELVVMQEAKDSASFCGDSYYCITTESYFLCVLADGLGSGEFAYVSSNAVIEVVKKHHDLPLDELIAICNEQLANKRGAAVAIMRVFFDRDEFEIVSVGNIRFFLFLPSEKKLIYPLPVTGFLSGKSKKFKVETYRREKDSKFILFSDGMVVKGVKSKLSEHNISLKCVGEELWSENTAQADDITMIIGSLLQ